MEGVLGKAEAAGAHPALTHLLFMQGLVVGSSGTKKARVPVSARAAGSVTAHTTSFFFAKACQQQLSVQLPGRGGKVRDMLQSCSVL